MTAARYTVCMEILGRHSKVEESLPVCHTHTVGRQLTDCNATIKGIVFPEAGRLRSRKVVSRSSSRPKGKYPSWKMKRMVEWESENELNAFRLLDCDPDVISFYEQPCQVMYIHDGQVKSHYPDILVKKKCVKELWKVKPDYEAEQQKIAARTSLFVQQLPLWGYIYRVVLAKGLAMQPRLANTRLILGSGRRTVTDCEEEFIRRALSRRGSLIWSDACRGEYGQWGREILCSLVLRGVLTIDWNSLIAPNTCFVARKEDS